MNLLLWTMVVIGTLTALMNVAVCYAACAIAGIADEQSDTARPGGNTSVAATHSDPVLGNAGRAQTPLRVLR